MANVPLVRSLLRLYARAKGELLELQAPAKKHHVRRQRDRETRELEAAQRAARTAQLQEFIAAIEVVVRWQVPDWDPSEVKTVRTFKRHQTTGHGGLSGAAIDVMRESGGERLTVRRVTQMACQSLELDWSGDNRERFRDIVGSALARLAKKGLLEHDGARRERRYWLSDEDDD